MNLIRNKNVISLIKIIIGVGLVALLLRSGKLDFKLALHVFSNPITFISVLFCFMGILFIGSYRWKKILEFNSKVVFSKRDIFFIQWIGGFFSSALPGAVTGDLIKLGYIKRHDHSISKKFLIFSVLLDRVLGLLALLFISGLGSLIFYSDLILISDKLKNIILINGLLFLLVLMGVGVFFLPQKIQNLFLSRIKVEKINELLIQIWSLSNKKLEFFKLFLISMFSHILSFSAFHLLNMNFYSEPVEFKFLTTIIPLGQVTTAIPISPSGLGVGHAAYQKLFEYLHVNNGATLFNNYWVFSTIFFVLGAIPYLLMSYQHKKVSHE